MKKRDLSLGIFVTFIWGANFSVIKLGLSSIDPFLLTSLRFTFCAIPLIFIVKKPKMHIVIIALYGLIFGVGLWGVVNLGIYSGLSSGLASLILQFSAFFTIILAAFIFSEQISKIQLGGIVIALAGLIFVLLNTVGTISFHGILLVLFGAICWSLCNILVRKYKPDDMLAFIIWSSIFSAIPLFMITFFVKGFQPFLTLYQTINHIAIFSIFFQAYITTIFGYWIWNSLMKKYPVSSVAPLSLFVPVSGLITSWIIFGESISTAKIFSCLVIFLGISIFVLSKVIDQYLVSFSANAVESEL